jgi:hypothetical protein
MFHRETTLVRKRQSQRPLTAFCPMAGLGICAIRCTAHELTQRRTQQTLKKISIDGRLGSCSLKGGRGTAVLHTG